MKHSQLNQWIFFIQIMKLFFIAILIFNNSFKATSQRLNIYESPTKTSKIKFVPVTNNYKKRFWRATTELAIVQVLPWLSNRFVRKAAFAILILIA